MTLRSATEHYQRQQRITAAGLIEAEGAARRGPMAVARAVTAYQIVAAKDAVDSLPAMLAEQGIPDQPVGTVAVSNIAGAASDGRPLVSLLEQAESPAQRAVMVATQLQDAARVAAGIGIAARPNVDGYARILTPPSCARCAILAGKFFKWNTGFQRHPRCDCRHIPSTEALSGDLTTDPRAYFNSLSPDAQVATFGKANSAAIREGADVGQVINAYRGTSTTALVTRGTSRARAEAAIPLRPREIPAGQPDIMAAVRVPVGRSTGRLTPEGIYRSAGSRAEAVDLLERHGYLIKSKAAAVVDVPKPLAWKRLTPDEIMARSDGTPLGNRVAQQAKQSYSRGQHTVTIETSMTATQTTALLDDVADVITRAGDALADKQVLFRVPTGDPKFRTSKRKGVTGGYVRQGEQTVHINPKVASGSLTDATGLMPVGAEVELRKYVVTHELGHILDNAHHHTRTPGTFTPSGIQLPDVVVEASQELFKRFAPTRFAGGKPDELSKYGCSSIGEGYAEAFAQWTLGGPGSSPVADAYAEVYGWR